MARKQHPERSPVGEGAQVGVRLHTRCWEGGSEGQGGLTGQAGTTLRHSGDPEGSHFSPAHCYDQQAHVAGQGGGADAASQERGLGAMGRRLT